MKKYEIKNAMQGHDRLAGRWEKQARREGKQSKAYAQYQHHLAEWIRLNELYKNV